MSNCPKLTSKKKDTDYVARDYNPNSSLSLPPQSHLTNLDRGAKMLKPSKRIIYATTRKNTKKKALSK